MPPLKAPSRTIEALPPDDVKAKIQAVEALTQSKTRALMRSIDRLTKENLALKTQSQEHRRSETFKKLESEMGIQDVIIMALTGELSKVHGMPYVEEKINEILHRGAPRLVTKTRQELIHENAVLRQKVSALSKKEKEAEQSIPIVDEVVFKNHEDDVERDELQLLQKRKLDAKEKENTELMVELESYKKLLKHQEELIAQGQRGAHGKNDFQREMALYEGQIHNLKVQLTRKEEQLKDTKRLRETDSTTIEKMQQEKRHHANSIEELKVAHEGRLNDQAISLNQKLNAAIKAKEGMEEKVTRLQQRNKTINAESKALKEKEAESQLRYDEEVSLKMQTQTKLEAIIEESRKDVKRLEDQLISHEVEMKKIRDSNEELKAQKATSEDKIRQMEDEVKEERTKMETEKKLMEEKQGRMETSKEHYAQLQKKFEHLEAAQLKEKDNMEAQLRDKDEELRKQKDSDDRSCPNCRKKDEDKKQMEINHEKQIADLEMRLKKGKDDDQLQEEIEELDEKLNGLEEEKEKLQNTANTLQLKLTDAQKMIKKQKTLLGTEDED